MIITANFRQFRTSEFIQFFADALTLCKQNKPDELNIKVQFDVFKHAHSILENNFKQNQKSGITAILAGLDERRDKATVCLNKISDGYLSHFDPKKREAAQLIADCINKYGDRIYSMNYQAQTSVLTSLGNELSNGLANSVKIINMTEVVEEMIVANKIFNAKFIDRIEESATDTSQSTSIHIKEVIKNYKTLCKHIEAHATINASESLLNTIDQLNALIQRYNYTMSLRGKSKSENESDFVNLN